MEPLEWALAIGAWELLHMALAAAGGALIYRWRQRRKPNPLHPPAVKS